MSFLDQLPAKYRLILCDIWGCVHDGVELYPGASERLCGWRDEGRKIVLITNAPRTAEAVAQQLGRIGLPSHCWDGLATSGEAGIAGLLSLGRPVGFMGTAADRAILEGRGVPIAADSITDLACTGLDETRREPEDYAAELERLAENGVIMHCLNPDRIVVRGGVVEACAGSLADIYETIGGSVRWYGKPHRPIYRHALELGGNPPAEHVLAIGDGLHTDVLGAARMGFDLVFVRGGIHQGEEFPSNFGPDNDLGDWQPVAVVDSLG